MEQERKMVMPTELVVGEIYADVPYLDIPPSLLKYEGLDENKKRFNFTLVNDRDFYAQEDGYVVFPSSCEFYLPTESELQTLKQTK